MYVLIDLEWVENNLQQRHPTQIACLRVDEKWHPADNFYTRIRPENSSFLDWTHVGYTGGTSKDFIDAPKRKEAIAALYRWLRPDDTICWWYDNCKSFFHNIAPNCTQKEVFLYYYIPTFLSQEPTARGNAYKVAKALGIAAPGKKNDARNDVEMIRRVLEYIQFPQSELENPPPNRPQTIVPTTDELLKGLPYVIDLGAKKIHKNGCNLIPEKANLKGCTKLTRAIGHGYTSCSCCRTEYMTTKHYRNQRIIDRTEYCYLYTSNSSIFHRRGCKVMLSASDIYGTIHYSRCISTGRRPCKICNPSPSDETMEYWNRNSSKRAVNEPVKPIKHITGTEQRAINRQKQAQLERSVLEKKPDLTKREKNDVYTLTQPRFAFWAAEGYRTFHLRNCRKISGLNGLEGFSQYQDAVRAGFRPCKFCKPSSKHDITISLPIYSRERSNESIGILVTMCVHNGFRYSVEGTEFTIETPVGIWKLHTDKAPYKLDHINLTVTPDNRAQFHRQPRLFLSMQDAITYIQRHDKTLIAEKETI